jgi:Cof subfamily protein (haloacid dehalogenase superfamily)
MPSVKLIVTDLDNTLLRRDKTISAYTCDVFRRARERGIRAVFATARPIRGVYDFLDLLDCVTFDAMIFHNGAVVHSGGKLAANFGIPPSLAEPILRRLHQNNMEAAVEINDRQYANFDASKIWKGIVCTASDFSDLPNDYADKIIVCVSSPADITRLAADLPPEVYIEINEGTLGLIMSREAAKLNAIQFIAQEFCISPAEIAAFGDDHNDIEMLRYCGVGVAVANAIDECKAAADCICGGCDDDGVATWIEENVLHQSA